MTFFHVVETNRFYAISPKGVIKLTPAHAYELGAGGVEFIKIQKNDTWNHLRTGLAVVAG